MKLLNFHLFICSVFNLPFGLYPPSCLTSFKSIIHVTDEGMEKGIINCKKNSKLAFRELTIHFAPK